MVNLYVFNVERLVGSYISPDKRPHRCLF